MIWKNLILFGGLLASFAHGSNDESNINSKDEPNVKILDAIGNAQRLLKLNKQESSKILQITKDDTFNIWDLPDDIFNCNLLTLLDRKDFLHFVSTNKLLMEKYKRIIQYLPLLRFNITRPYDQFHFATNGIFETNEHTFKVKIEPVGDLEKDQVLFEHTECSGAARWNRKVVLTKNKYGEMIFAWMTQEAIESQAWNKQIQLIAHAIFLKIENDERLAANDFDFLQYWEQLQNKKARWHVEHFPLNSTFTLEKDTLKITKRQEFDFCFDEKDVGDDGSVGSNGWKITHIRKLPKDSNWHQVLRYGDWLPFSKEHIQKNPQIFRIAKTKTFELNTGRKETLEDLRAINSQYLLVPEQVEEPFLKWTFNKNINFLAVECEKFSKNNILDETDNEIQMVLKTTEENDSFDQDTVNYLGSTLTTLINTSVAEDDKEYKKQEGNLNYLTVLSEIWKKREENKKLDKENSNYFSNL